VKVKSLPLALMLVLGLTQSVKPATAYNYYNYSPYQFLYLGQGLLYPLTRGLFGPFYGGYNANPLYMGSFFMKRNASYAQQWPNVYPYNPTAYTQYGYRNAGMPPNSGNSNNSGNSSGNANNSQPSPSSQQYSDGPFTLPGMQPGPAGQAPPPQSYNYQQSAPPASAQSNYPGYQAPVGGNTAPPPPQGFGMPLGGSDGSRASAASPLAESFINHVNNRFNGDMSKALSDTETRNWAKSMGVVEDGITDGSHLNGERLDVLGKILKDDSLDSVSKLDTMKILLKKKPAAQ
jgi:hypothetical protein